MNLDYLLNDIRIIEAKQVGIIYHFTYPSSLEKILKDGSLETINDYVSFTRNFQLTGFGQVRIAFDGDKLSEKYSIEPFADVGLHRNNNGRESESEERIVWKPYSPLPVISPKYVIQIDIKPEKAWVPIMKAHRMEYFKRVQAEFPQFKINIVESWRPVK